MSIPVHRWKRLIRQTLEQISDGDYQRRAWFNKGNEYSSPDELINQLYDDYQFDEFIQSREVALPSLERKIAEEFDSLMRRFIKRTAQHLDPYKVVDDPLWNEVREKAKQLLSISPG